ncbi:MAG TPA: DUF2027 domain-containing protein [Bacteroidia bacterium]|nr:DUF2027 domain-containing protein [Bacteroidia bacterium]
MKKFKIGDKVKFLNEKGGGTIVAIKNDFEVIVQLNDGLEIPYPSNELILDNKNLIINTSSSALNEDNNVDKFVVYLAIESNTSDPKNASEYYLHLCNLSEYQFYYTYSIGKNAVYQCVSHGSIHGFEMQRIKTLTLPLIKEIDAHQIQMIFFQENLFSLQNPVFETIKINDKTFSPSLFIQHPKFRNPVFIIILKENFSIAKPELLHSNSRQNIKVHLSDEDLQKISALKEKNFYPTKVNKQKQKYSEEMMMDLHIEELVEDPGNYTAHEKLQIQLNYFQREIHNAIANNVKKITIIHGVGNGRLKHEVRYYLQTLDEIKSIEDAPYKTHGFGATVVYIK